MGRRKGSQPYRKHTAYYDVPKGTRIAYRSAAGVQHHGMGKPLRASRRSNHRSCYRIGALHRQYEQCRKAQEKLNEDSDAFRQKLEEERQAIDECINIIRDKTETDYAQIAAYERLKKLCPELTNAYTMQELAASDLSDTTKRLNEIQDEETYQHKIEELNKYRSLLEDIKTAEENWSNLSKENADLLREKFGTGLLENKQERVQISVDSLQKDVDEIERIRKEAEYAALPLDTKLELAIDERDSIKQEFDRVKKKSRNSSARLKTVSGYGTWISSLTCVSAICREA